MLSILLFWLTVRSTVALDIRQVDWRTSRDIKLTTLGRLAVKDFWLGYVTFRVAGWIAFTELNRAK